MSDLLINGITYNGVDSIEVPKSDGGIAVYSEGGGSSGDPTDPVAVYNATRPAGWLPMPEPAANEMYLLFHIPDGVSGLIAFTVTCTGSYTVALGTIANGVFVQQSATSITGGSKYEAELFASDFGNLTNGMKQAMIKVSGTDILTWTPSTHSKKTSPASFAGWNIVEIACNLPSGTHVGAGNSTTSLALRALKYFTWLGTNNVTDMSYMFSCCASLAAIPQLDTSKVTTTYDMFLKCASLVAIPQLDTSKVTDMSYMFSTCSSLAAIPQLDTSKVTSMYSMFLKCSSLATIPQLDTSNATTTSGMFSTCDSLVAVPQLDLSKVTITSGMFSNCYPLASVALTPTVENWAGFTINISDCSLCHCALVRLFDSLPTITSARAINITGNPGVSELTDVEKVIATSKNWTLTL